MQCNSILIYPNADEDDYLSTSAVVTFRYGETLHNVTIFMIDDLYAEPTEYFSVGLEAIGQEVVVFPITECTVAIQDNDCKYYNTVFLSFDIFQIYRLVLVTHQ